MSSVRMCDRCGDIFSERAENWSTFTGSTRRKDPDTGEFKSVTDSLDSCPECTELMTTAQRPTLPSHVSGRYEQPRALETPNVSAAAVPGGVVLNG